MVIAEAKERYAEEIIRYKGQERRRNWPYTEDEQAYIGKLIEILRGSNKKNAGAIRVNIDALHETRNVIPSEVKKTKEA